MPRHVASSLMHTRLQCLATWSQSKCLLINCYLLHVLMRFYKVPRAVDATRSYFCTVVVSVCLQALAALLSTVSYWDRPPSHFRYTCFLVRETVQALSYCRLLVSKRISSARPRDRTSAGMSAMTDIHTHSRCVTCCVNMSSVLAVICAYVAKIVIFGM